MQKRLTNDEKLNACCRYKNGESSELIGKFSGVSGVAIRGILKRRGIELRSPSECQRKYFCDESAFNGTLNNEQAYWIGFLMADGCIHRNEIILGLHIKDKEHIYKFRSFLKSNHPIHNRRNLSELRIRSQKICDELIRFGILPQKSFTAKANECLTNNKHFWRGHC